MRSSIANWVARRIVGGIVGGIVSTVVSVVVYGTVCGIALSFCATGSASTFVGNGGNAGDIELLVAKKEILGTLMTLAEGKTASELCVCNNEFSGRSICEPLAALSKEQQSFCATELVNKAKQLLPLLGSESPIDFHYTHDTIEVKDETASAITKAQPNTGTSTEPGAAPPSPPSHTTDSKSVRAADAVADRTKRLITIQQNRFTDMSPPERVFLLTHELLHFTDDNGEPLTDTGEIGPFTGENGRHVLVNAMAAAIVMEAANQKQFKIYRAQNSRSRSWKRVWVSAQAGGVQSPNNSSGFAMSGFTYGQITARHYFGIFAPVLSYRSESGQNNLLQTISNTEDRQIFGIGLSARYFPSSNPLSFWGQTHFTLTALLEHWQCHFESKDGTAQLTDSASAWGGRLQFAYLMPLWWGFWGHVDLDLAKADYRYANLGFGYNNLSSSLGLGVSYAF